MSHDGNLPKAVDFVHNGEALSGAYRKGQVRLWNSSDGTKLQTLTHSSNTSVTSISGYSDKSDKFLLVTACKERIAEELRGEVTPLGLTLFTQILAVLGTLGLMAAILTATFYLGAISGRV
ncbi:hypothetical protein K474DRAFT_1712428 [Panus rudis PR-1116 ss-1]|nr:hypothetical protein K474DRAFT_1712428 [Panus rudis PR-1116 ss-1]